MTVVQFMLRKLGRIPVSLEYGSQKQKDHTFPSASHFQRDSPTICSPQGPSDGTLLVVKSYCVAIRLVITVVMPGNDGYYRQLSNGLELISSWHVINKIVATSLYCIFPDLAG